MPDFSRIDPLKGLGRMFSLNGFVEVGKALGARVIACAGSAEKLAVAKAHGADDLIDYRSENLRSRVREIADGGECHTTRLCQ